MRILEFGPTPIVKSAYPENTIFVGTGLDPSGGREPGSFDFSLADLRRTHGLLQDSSFDAVFVTRLSTQRTGFHTLLRSIANRRVVSRGVPAVRTFGDRMLRLRAGPPIIVFDPSDASFMPRNVMWLWRRAVAVFKRELPLDPWQMFTRTVHGDLPTPRFRGVAVYRSIVDKVRPMSLGLSAEIEAAIPRQLPAKTVDVFFAGNVEGNSWLREKGLQELAALRDTGAGIEIDVAESRLPLREFLMRCAQARLVWSPAGLGHDTFRHYEAAACGAVPLISRSPILQYAPFEHGETAFFYAPEPGGLTATLRQALERRDALAAMGLAARAHAFAHHTLRARVNHMLEPASVGRA